jgi:hypothetical protein
MASDRRSDVYSLTRLDHSGTMWVICLKNIDEIECLFHLTKKAMMLVSFNATENLIIGIVIPKRKMNADYFAEKIIQSLASP